MALPFLDQIYESLKKIQQVQADSNKLKQTPETKQSKNFRPDEGVSTKGESSLLGQVVPSWIMNEEKDNLYLRTPMPDSYGYDTLGKKEFVVTANKPRDPVLPDWFMDIAENETIRQTIGRVVTNIFDKEYDYKAVIEKVSEDPVEALNAIIEDRRMNLGDEDEVVSGKVPLYETNADALMRDMFGLPHRTPNDLVKQKDGTYALDINSSDHNDISDLMREFYNNQKEGKEGFNTWLLGNYRVRDLGDSYEVYDKWDVAVNPNETSIVTSDKEIDRMRNTAMALRHVASAFIKPSEVKFKVTKKEVKEWSDYFDSLPPPRMPD